MSSTYTRCLILAVVIILCGCESSLPRQSLTLITDAWQLPDFQEAFRNKSDGLLESIDQSLQWLEKPSSKSHLFKHFASLTHEQSKQSLVAFRNLLVQSTDAEEFATGILSQFNIYQSTGNNGQDTVLFTGYFAPEYSASRTRTQQFKYPLYSLPEKFIEDNTAYWPTRYEIESRKLLVGYEIAWLKDPLSVYLIQVNGSAKLFLPDGSSMYVGYTTTNKHKYTSLGKLIVAAGLSRPEEMSMQKIREIYNQTPESVQEMMLENDRFVFFNENCGNNWPRGSIGIALTPQASLAMDKTIFPPVGIFLVDTQIEQANTKSSHYVRFMLNQDTGAAIKGPSRADIYMGVGHQAGAVAGKLKSQGKLFYFLIKHK